MRIALLRGRAFTWGDDESSPPVAVISEAAVVSSMLFGVSATDPSTFASVSALLILVSRVAGHIPARRATKVNPMVALRYE